MPARRKASTNDTTANLGFEAKLWLASDKLRKSMDAVFPVHGQEQRVRGTRYGRAQQARRVMLRRQQPNQSNPTTRRLAIMNLALRGIEADFGPENADTFRCPLHPELRADLHQFRTLAILRDTVLPKLLSGELSLNTSTLRT